MTPGFEISRSTQIAAVLAGFGGLMAGLTLLEWKPILGVLEVLGSMALVLEALAGLRSSSK